MENLFSNNYVTNEGAEYYMDHVYAYGSNGYYGVSAMYGQGDSSVANHLSAQKESMDYVNYEELALDYMLNKEKLKSKILALIIGLIVGLLIGEGDISVGLIFAGFLYIPNKISHAMNCTIIGYFVNYVIFALVVGFMNPPAILAVVIIFAGIIDVALSVVPMVKYHKIMK